MWTLLSQLHIAFFAQISIKPHSSSYYSAQLTNINEGFCSETRLIEVMEHLCKKEHLEDSKKFSGIKDLEFKVRVDQFLLLIFFHRKLFAYSHINCIQCHELVEEHEEDIENWYFHRQNSDPDFLIWLCHDKLRLCCREGHFGVNCKPCPGVDKGFAACSGHGKCLVIIAVSLNFLISMSPLLFHIDGVFKQTFSNIGLSSCSNEAV